MKPFGECTDCCVQGGWDKQSGTGQPIPPLLDAKTDLLEGARIAGPHRVAVESLGKIKSGCHERVKSIVQLMHERGRNSNSSSSQKISRPCVGAKNGKFDPLIQWWELAQDGEVTFDFGDGSL